MATSLVTAIRGGIAPEELLVDAIEAGTSGGGAGWVGNGPGSSRHSAASGGRRRRVGGGVGGGGAGVGSAERQQYPALVERAVETLLKVSEACLRGGGGGGGGGGEVWRAGGGR